MKNSLKIIGKFILSWLLSFVVIYLFVFFAGHKLFESGDVILQEIGVSFVVGVVLLFSTELFVVNNKKIEKLEKRVEELENQILNK